MDLAQSRKVGGNILNDMEFIGVKPNAIAEASVIGAILLDADNVMPECEGMLSHEDFLIGEYRTLYRTMSGHFVDGKPIDAVTLIAQLGDAYRTVIIETADTTPSIGSWKTYAQIVLDTAKRHRAFESARNLITALSEQRDIQRCQQIAVTACEQLSSTTASNAMSAKEGFRDLYLSLQEPVEYISTGFSSLDRYTFICKGDFVVIGARPSVGKTALTLQMLLSMSRSYKVVYFSLETRNRNLFGRMVANLGGIELHSIKTGNDISVKEMDEAGRKLNELNFHTVEAAGWTVPQIKAKAVQLGAEIIFVDYMGLIRSEGNGRYEKMTNVSVDLHTIAQQSKIAVIALSQLNREGKEDPTMEALRESGQIEQDADMILLLRAPEEIENPARDLIIAKNKEGQVGRVALRFDGKIQKFSEIETRYQA